MCMLLKLDYAKFGVSNFLFSKVIEVKVFVGVGSTLPSPSPPLVKEGLKDFFVILTVRLSVSGEKLAQVIIVVRGQFLKLFKTT